MLDWTFLRVDNLSMDMAVIERRVAATGLIVRGMFHPEPDDNVPGAARTLVLVGDVSGRLWPHFTAARRDEADPLDAWTKRVVGPAARDLGARPVYPFDGPPYLPFQKWAMRAEGLKPSPVGTLIHPKFGLWHSYRAALLFDMQIEFTIPPEPERPCDSCSDRPCISSCPVGAFKPGKDFDLAACLGHLKGPHGEPCMTRGCQARNACPVGAGHAYEPDHQAFLSHAFVAAFGR